MVSTLWHKGHFHQQAQDQSWASAGGAQKPGTFSKVTGSNLPPVREVISQLLPALTCTLNF